MKTEIVNFYWVSSSYTSPDPAWQIAVRQTAETLDEVDMLGGVRSRVIEALNVAQAAELGITIETIGEAIDAASLAAVERAEAEAAALRSNLDAALAENARLVEQVRVRTEQIAVLQHAVASPLDGEGK